MKDYNRTIKMICPLCGNDQFSTLDHVDNLLNASDDTKIQCADCKKVFTKAQLLEENQYIVDENIEEVKNEVIKDLEKQFKKMFK